jgi:hypothetical protein
MEAGNRPLFSALLTNEQIFYNAPAKSRFLAAACTPPKLRKGAL